MKKLLLVFAILFLCLFGFAVKAEDEPVIEETPEVEIEETIEEVEEVTEEIKEEVEEQPKEETPKEELGEEIKDKIDETVEENPEEYESFKQELTDKLSEYLDGNYVTTIISWLIDTGVLSAMFVIWLKYRKYKHNTVEEVLGGVKNEVKGYVNEHLSPVLNEEIDKLKNALEEVQKSNELIMKVLVLMEDKTKEGKIELLDYLGTKTKNEEVKKQAEIVKEKLEEEKKAEKEVLKKVEDDYHSVF